MLQHHEATLARTVEAFRQDKDVRAVIVGGSVAKGTARPDSDVDLMLVMTEAGYAPRRRGRDCTLLRYEPDADPRRLRDRRFCHHRLVTGAPFPQPFPRRLGPYFDQSPTFSAGLFRIAPRGKQPD